MISEEQIQAPVVVPRVASETLLDLLRQRCEERPSELIYRFLSDDGREIEDLTYTALDRQARAIAHLLQESGAYGQPVLLVLPPGLQFVSAFFGCLYAGAIATPAYPPASEKNALRLSSIAADARPFVGLTTSSIMNSRRRSVAELITSAGIRWLNLDTLQQKRADAWRPPRIEAGTLALLQYTSGSTAAPKGVMITHANLLHNQSLIQRAFGQTEQSIIVSWLPLYHDMGLIGAVLQPLYVGAECVLLSPMAFLQRPVRWLEVISKYRATTSGGPNFAFDLCARKVTQEQKRDLDLSSWSVAFNGAEPILAGTLDRFASEFEECGFRRSAFRPCYGLAEATLLVSAAEADGPRIIEADARALELNRVEQPTSPATTRQLVSSGPPVSGQALAIVNPETLERCEPNQVGEIWVSGPGVSGGYWKRPHETRERLMASLPGDTNTYLRTGDLGFLNEHDLFVTGRLKELIIVHGLNYHPLDIEITAQKTNPALRAGCGAAFSIEEGGQQSIVLVQEIERDAFTVAESLFAHIRDAVTREHELSLDTIALVLPVSLPKTSSGKIRRAECREQFLAGELRIVAQWENLRPAVEQESRTVEHRESIGGGPVSALENLLIRIWGDVLELRSLHSGSNFFEAGGDSVSAAQVIARVSRELGKEIPLHLLFDNPTVARFATALVCIDAGLDKKPVLRRLGLKEAALSYSQQRLWIDEQLRAGQTVYNISMGLSVSGDLDVSALQSSLNEIVRRHESLRTRFTSNDGEPRQVIVPHLRLDMSLVDLSGPEQEDVEARLRKLLRAEAAKPFNLEEIPLVRATLVRLGARRHVLVLIVHHIVCDGWSAAVMLRELSKLYAALAQGRPSPLEELPIQYADFAVRQREILQGEVLEALLGYWRKQLAGVPYYLQLPADHPRPVVNLHRGARRPLHLNAELSRRLATLGQQEDATLFMTLAALFQILLSRYSGQQEFLLGCPIANRSEVETQNLIGFLVNTVVLHCDLREDLAFRPLLRRVREIVIEAHNHQDLPFEKLVEELRPEREPGSTPLFQVMLLLRQAEPVIEVEGLRLEPLKIETDVAMYDLTLELTESAEGLRGGFEYNVDLFDAATIERFANHFLNLARAVVEEENASTPVSRLPLLSEGDRRQLLVEWNDTRCDYGRAACLHELVEEQVERTPDAIAVSSVEGLLSYRELHARARQLGNWLHEQGVGPESRVGVCMTRSLEMLVALLGVLESGAAYVPLDPGYPRERLVYMTQDAGLHIILTQQALAAEIPGMARLLCLDTQWEQVTACKSPTRRKAIPDNVAYLIYTSGSTGKPKGVMNSHRGIVNRLRWMRAHYKVGTADRFIQKTPFSFDVSVWEFFAPLISGSCLVMAKPEGHRDPMYLAETLADEQITIVHFVPAMLQPFLEHAEPQRCRSVRQFICSGEALTTELQERFFRIMSAHLDNLYGPTEAAVEVTAWRCRADYARVPIGRPISNLCAYVLDRWQEPMPVGVSGELYIGGTGVARGYWRRPDLTAERFLPDPFSSLPGARLYRTGDLVRWLPDGTLEFLGRLDDQVKIRGHRVEPSEITSLLCEHPDVGQAVVRAWGHDTSHRLVAYVVARAGCESLKSGELRSYLKGRVPDYMMPSAFVLLEELPLTPSGKVNTSALPEVAREAIEEGQSGGGKGIGGRREIEEMVAGVWAEVLGIEEVGGDENFFDLGGHSLLATQVVARVSRQIGVRVGLRDLFEAPTLNHFALRVERALRGGSYAGQEPQIVKADRDSELPLSFAQQRLWFIDQFDGSSRQYNMPAAMRIQGRFDEDIAEHSLRSIIRRHEPLRTTFINGEEAPLQQIQTSFDFHLTRIDLSGVPRDEQEQAVAEALKADAVKPFDLSADLMLRASFLRLSADEGVLLFNMHHIASDGWSMGILVDEFAQLYEAFSQGKPDPLQPLSIQYADYAKWQREWLQGEVLERQFAYWEAKLAALPQVHTLPLDRPRPAVQTLNGATHTLDVDRAAVEGLKGVARSGQTTLFMVLQGVFALLLSRYSNSNDIVLGTPVANRPVKELEPLVGFFVNTLVLRTDCSAGQTFREYLTRVRQVNLEAQAHQDVPFEYLVERLKPHRSTSQTALFQIMFSMNMNQAAELHLRGATLTPLQSDEVAVKFDLMLDATEQAGGLRLKFTYNRDLFDAATIVRMGEHLNTLMRGVVADPDTKIETLPLLSEDERKHLLFELNETAVEYPHEICLPQLFEAQVARTPQAVALTVGDTQLTYRQLNEQANRLAHYLRARAVGCESLVAIFMSRRAEMIVSLLGVLKAGAAYLPLDPTYPQERLGFMLEDSRAQMLLTNESLLDRLPPYGGTVVSVDRQWEEIALESAENLGRTALPESLAYTIYTSGSTGRPKGVMVSHRAISNHLLWRQDTYPLCGSDRFLHKASSSFDISVWEIMAPLTSGAQLVLADVGGEKDSAYLVRAIAEQRITMAHFGPAMLQAFLEEPGVEECRSLRHVFCGGEPLTQELAELFFRRVGARLHQQYGPTEATVDVTSRKCAPGERHERIPIGRPIGNARVYLLDSELQPVPQGVPAELYLGGIPLARGYLNRPALTAERFVPDPFSSEPGARVYRTGDMGRHLAGGEIEFLGRLDQQVKLRGYRIELGEIEAALAGVEGVEAAAVVMGEYESGQKRLVAYVTPEGGGWRGESEARVIATLRIALQARLPDYMVPSAFVLLDEMPLTPNGKVDRKALPAPQYHAADSQAPTSPTEQILCAIFSQVLKLRGVGVNDDFFELGGHSLSATQVVSRIKSAFGVDLPLRVLFESPTVAAIARHVQVGSVSRPPIRALDRTVETPQLSYAQQRLWFIDRFGGGSPQYNMPAALRIRGHFDADTAERVLRRIVERHEPLRTLFLDGDGGPRPLIRDSFDFNLTRLDLSGLTPGARERAVAEAVEEDAIKPFDLGSDLMLRASFLRLSDEEGVLLFNVHHIASDGWSIGVLVEEFSKLYEAFSRGEGDPLEPLAIQYADYAQWQREWLSGEVLEEQVSYWERQLANLPQVHSVPLDRPRPARQTFAGATHTLELDSATLDALKEVAGRNQSTLFMVLQGVFALLVSRHSNSSDVVMGTPVANRVITEVEPLVGFFVNTLVLRTDCSPGQTFQEYLAHVRKANLDAQAHQDVPFEYLVERLRPERSVSHSPVFQIMFSMNTDQAARVALEGLELERLRAERVAVTFDLMLDAAEIDGTVRLTFAYNWDLFEARTIERMGEHLRILIEGVIADPGQKIERLPLLSRAERERLVTGLNATAAEYPSESSVPELFEAQAARTPEAVALVCGDTRLTYRELDERANRLARYLHKHGAGAETLVAIYMERRVEMLVSLLGVLKAGAAYLPLDPSYPHERLGFMLQDSQAPMLLTNESLLDRLPPYGGTVVAVDRQWEEIAQERPESLRRVPLPESLAYTIYTSGSTGKPKGVQVSNRAFVNLLWTVRDWPGITPHDVVLAETSLSFDIAGVEVFLPLLVGASIKLVGRDVAVDASLLRRELEQGVTLMQATPSGWLLLLESGWEETPGLKAVTAGEALSPDLATKLRRRCDSLWNMYGPTETTIYSLGGEVVRGSEQITIGRPVGNTQVYVLDESMELVPEGVSGELYIGGDGLARGYLNRGALTAERFIPDPFSFKPGARLYKTGDLVRYLPDGRVEFLGRLDHQVKLRGYRIEPGEIECLLRAHPAVGSAAVVARACAGGDKRLVAYVALINNSSSSPAELRGHLRRQLPEYMVPATFVLLPALPLTPNGKVDRESLPDPEQPAGDGYEQPRNEIEELLAGIWSDVLGLELVGREQNFFDLGGHSLVATQVISRVREIFGVDLPVRTLFSTPTISGIAEAIRAAQHCHQTPSQPQLRHVERGPLLPLSFAQQRLWFMDQLEPGGHAYVIPAAVRLSGELNDAALHRALIAIAQRHENLRTRFVNTDGTPMQVIDAEPGFEFRLADLSCETSGEELETRANDLIHDETRRAFDLSREHLFRALLIRLSAKEHILLITVHHIVSDAWSMGVLLREFKALYQAYCDGTPPALPDFPVQYVDYAAWQRDYLRGEMLERQLSYWRQQLKGAEPLELPTDHARPPVQTYKGAAEPFVLSASLVKDIRHLGRQEGCTLFMTLLAAFQILLSKYSGQRDVLVGTPIAGRTHADLEGLIGFFVNTLVMRTNMTGESTLREILQRVRESALGAYAHQDLPFEKLIEDLQPARDPSRSPLFQVMFIFQHSSREEEEFKGLNVKPLEVEVTAAKFDLTLTVLGDSEELSCVIEYNTDLFERDRILRLIRHFNVVLEAITANPDQSFSTLALLAHDEQEKILKDWNATEVKYTGERHVARIFEIQAARTPDRVAFIEGERRLSYGELNRRANRLARRLKQSSLREEFTAAVCMRRSPDMMVALLAIIKAGGAYVPIDPELPVERIAMMLSDSNARLVITERSLSERVSKGDAEVIRLDADWGEIETYDSSNLSCSLGGDAALYLIYTSGSTGRPKGVLGTHGGTLNRFRWMWEAFPFEDGEVCSLKTSLSFVDSVWECFGPLLAGVPTVMIPETMVGNAEALVSRLAQESVTRIVLVPSLLETLVENYSNLGELLPALRFWVCSGETLAGQLAERFHAAMPRGRLINLYGCSEVAGDVTYHIGSRTPSTKPVPIGRPVANTQIYILDEYMNPCGIGLPGQIYVGGAHLARGYWNRPDETADRFVPNPFATHAGQRLYRTGDLGRYARSGEIEYLGRLDYQLKVRGYRIESSEIESILGQHPNVRMIQVVAADVGSSDKKLVAYVVLNETGESANRDLYDYAARFLPSYMIPSAFVPLEKFSLLPNGKINRRALPAAGRSNTLSVGTAAAASTPVEASLVEIWREVLGLDQVGIYDNFFDLGGHSLALVKVRARIESRFSCRVSLPELFTYPTIAALSRHLIDAGKQNDLLAEVRRRSARQKESSRRTRQQRIEQRLKLQEITS